ncbi:MAG: hypothetical protein SGJ24_09245 [Chloroflexota bacterium]|nr:hypothetical protein [Chloroflexota bacterium]
MSAAPPVPSFDPSSVSSAEAGETFTHPSPRFERGVLLWQLGLAIILVVLILAQVPLLFAGMPIILALLVIMTCLALIPFTLLPTVAAPAVTLTTDGITIQPHFWRPEVVPWSDVRAIKPYPLMPSAGSENTRRLLIGRRKYSPMEGIMLIIPSLPALYRIQGVIVNEGWTGVIGLTNRTHINYARLIALVPGAVDLETIHDTEATSVPKGVSS